MYVPRPFRVHDPRQLTKVISDFPLATLVRNGTEGPIVAHVPLVCETEGGRIIRLIGHIAKANPFWRTAHNPKVVAVFSGPDGYVSAGLYPSKHEHGKVVPTWNYIRVEVAGRMFVETEHEKLPFYIRRPTEEMERHRDPPWSIDDVPRSHLEKLMSAIVGIRIDVQSAVGAWKFDQHKSQADQAGVIKGLVQEGQAELAAAIKRTLSSKARDS